MGQSLEEIQSRLAKFRDDRDWARFHSPANLASAISVEAAELVELFLWSSQENEAQVLESRQEDIEAELADVLIQCLNFAAATDIDVLTAVDRKITRNAEKYPVDQAKGKAAKYTEL